MPIDRRERQILYPIRFLKRRKTMRISREYLMREARVKLKDHKARAKSKDHRARANPFNGNNNSAETR